MTDLKPIPVYTLMDARKQMPPIPDQTAVVYQPTDEAKALVRGCDVLIAVDVTNPERFEVLKAVRCWSGSSGRGPARR